jgi:hypothetical protein
MQVRLKSFERLFNKEQELDVILNKLLVSTAKTDTFFISNTNETIIYIA